MADALMRLTEDDLSQRRADQATSASYAPPPDGVCSTGSVFDIIGAGLTAEQHDLFHKDAKHTKRPTDRLFLAGDRSLLSLGRKRVAIVGTREVTDRGASRARRLAKELSDAGVLVVSGLARGVDTHALSSAIECGGRVIAVIGTPLDKATPVENTRLQEQIYRDHLLVSPFENGTIVQKGFFPQRNRVMAALTDATVIIEAADTSGTLHQAAECERLKRWLFIAKSVVEDQRLTWPKRFLPYEKTRVLDSTGSLLAALGL